VRFAFAFGFVFSLLGLPHFWFAYRELVNQQAASRR
jgi:hypothetical protein